VAFRVVEAFQQQRGSEPPSNKLPVLRYQSPTEASLHLDTLEDETARICAHMQDSGSSEASRALLEEENAYVIVCFDSWYAALKATTSQAFMMTPEDALAWDVLEKRYYIARSSCTSNVSRIQRQGIRN
jgi:hypothetical protein